MRFSRVRVSLLFAAAVMFLGSPFISGCRASRPAVGSEDRLPPALLWKIEGRGLGQPSYLFGTIHLIPEEAYFYPEGFEAAFAQARRVVFEIDLNEMGELGAMMGMLTSLMMKGGETIDDLMTPAEYREVSAYFEDMGMPMFLLNRVKPMFLSMLAEVDMDPGALDSERMKSYEMELNDRALADGKKTGGLETMAFQLSLFDSIPYTDQARMLLDAVRGTQAESDAFQETLKLYSEQRVEDMATMIGEADQASHKEGNMEQVLLINRNRNWIPVMHRMMQLESVLFAVGAGHLAGAEGVIRLLQREGYTVTPVSVHKPGVRRL